MFDGLRQGRRKKNRRGADRSYDLPAAEPCGHQCRHNASEGCPGGGTKVTSPRLTSQACPGKSDPRNATARQQECHIAKIIRLSSHLMPLFRSNINIKRTLKRPSVGVRKMTRLVQCLTCQMRENTMCLSSGERFSLENNNPDLRHARRCGTVYCVSARPECLGI